MKNIFSTCILVLAFVCGLQAQSFQKGTNLLSAGIGLGGSFGGYAGTRTPALSLQYERGAWEAGPGVFSLGGYAGVQSFKYSGGYSSYKYTQKWSYKILGVRSAYHYTGFDIEKLDVYGGAMLSYNILSYSYSDNGLTGPPDNGSYGSAASLSFYAGGRYAFASNLAGFAELGYGISYLTLGASFKF